MGYGLTHTEIKSDRFDWFTAKLAAVHWRNSCEVTNSQSPPLSSSSKRCQAVGYPGRLASYLHRNVEFIQAIYRVEQVHVLNSLPHASIYGQLMNLFARNATWLILDVGGHGGADESRHEYHIWARLAS